ncbi:MAG: hypothetical protein P8Y18_09355, partial [Candidatus Bathyarchaeota archaeon]
MSKASIKNLLMQAEDSEQKYEWLLAAELYKKASSIAKKRNSWLKAAKLCKKIGFCYFRAAYQAEDYPEYEERIKLAAKAYEKESDLLK